MLVAVCPAYGPALDRAIDAGTVHPTSKGQHGVSLRAKENVLLVDRPFQFSLLARSLVMAGYSDALLHELHKLRAVLAIWSFRVNYPIPSDVRRRLPCIRDIAGNEQQ